MTGIIKQIREILGNHDTSVIKINIWTTNIWFDIYESEIPIMIDKNRKTAYIDWSLVENSYMTADILDELSKVIRVLETNIDTLLDFID